MEIVSKSEYRRLKTQESGLYADAPQVTDALKEFERKHPEVVHGKREDQTPERQVVE